MTKYDEVRKNSFAYLIYPCHHCFYAVLVVSLVHAPLNGISSVKRTPCILEYFSTEVLAHLQSS